MRGPVLAIASGKGGTGKTTVSVNLAAVSVEPLTLLDCDVEAPNAHLFIKPVLNSNVRVEVPIPAVSREKCTGCGLCSEACRFNAVAILTGFPTFFPELCHSCGNCVRSCPENALSEIFREIGTLRSGSRGLIHFADGVMDIGEARSSPLIDRVRAEAAGNTLTIVDAPPGTSCPAVSAVRGASYVILVTEPTPFGLHDLQLAAEMVQDLGIKAGVIINRSGMGSDDTECYCRDKGLPVLARIPFDREVARSYTRGEILTRIFPEYRDLFRGLLENIIGEYQR
jgi:MinD superfamily P-loop ATPase